MARNKLRKCTLCIGKKKMRLTKLHIHCQPYNNHLISVYYISRGVRIPEYESNIKFSNSSIRESDDS